MAGNHATVALVRIALRRGDGGTYIEEVSPMEKSMLTKILLTIAVVLGGGGFLVYSSVSHAQHYMMVDELVRSPQPFEQWNGKEVKIHGFVEAGSIVESVVGQVEHRSFVLQKDGNKVRVFSQGPKPDTFKDQSEVVATGRIVKASEMQQLATGLCQRPEKSSTSCPIRADAEQSFVVESTELMAKCPSKYDGATSNKLNTKF
jgi:cytochrome c-type biogenesis protein CcmE